MRNEAELPGKDHGESVYLNFKKQYDGTLSSSYASGRLKMHRNFQALTKADWTKNYFDASIRVITLIHQTATVEDIVGRSSAEYQSQIFCQEFKRNAAFLYSDYDAEMVNKSVYLSLDTKEAICSYLLITVGPDGEIRDLLFDKGETIEIFKLYIRAKSVPCH